MKIALSKLPAPYISLKILASCSIFCLTYLNLPGLYAQDFVDSTGSAFLAMPTPLIESSSAFGDIDNDGDLDLIMAGEASVGNPQTIFYRNNAGQFVEEAAISSSIINVWKAGLGWGDYNNDGFIDLLICGEDITGTPVSNLYTNNGGVSFDLNATASSTIQDVLGATVKWADYDNDGDLDVLVLGETATSESTKLYKNQNNVFVEDIAASNLFEDVEFGDAAFGDVNNDGHLDLVIQGLSNNIQGSVDPFTGLYMSNGVGGFNAPSFPFTFVQEGSLDWNDFDNDGFLDLLLTGKSLDDTITKVYRNTGGGAFATFGLNMNGIQKGRASWGDYDEDGYADVLLVGEDDKGMVAKVFKNNSANTLGDFFEDPLNTGILTPMDQGATAIWGDYDGDDKLDILLTGRVDTLTFERKIGIYRNINGVANISPGAPQNLISNQIFDEVLLQWDPPNGLGPISENSLSYNVYVGTAPLNIDEVSPMSDLTNGDRRIVARGNVSSGTTWPIRELAGGTYYWNVQAIDADFEGSAWNTEGVFVFVPPEPTFQDVSGTAFPGGFPGRIESSSDWGDYDNDGDLDLVVAGELSPFNYETSIYENIGGTFVKDPTASAALVDVKWASVTWADYNNDGSLDLLVMGQDATGNSHTNLYENNGSGQFALDNTASNVFVDALGGSVVWGDYNRDGFIDLIAIGEEEGAPKTRVYRNLGSGQFEEDIIAGVNLPDVDFGDVDLSDFDKDGDLDLLISGQGAGSAVTDVYENDNGVFVSTGASVLDLQEGSAEWGDFTNDGYPDILLTGQTTGGSIATKVYVNNKMGDFIDSGIALMDVKKGRASWGDYNFDGFLDILLVGEEVGGTRSGRLYLNDAGSGFTEDTDNQNLLTGIDQGASAIWGDYNGDNKLDIFLTGRINDSFDKTFELYENIATGTPTLPGTPFNLQALLQGNEMQLSWNPPLGYAAGLVDALTYNLYISSTTPTVIGDADLRTPHAEVAGGYRKVVRPGNNSHSLTFSLKDLPTGTYKWSVQAITPAFQSTPFPTEETFFYQGPDFVDVSANYFPIPSTTLGLDEGDLSWADYDNDGDLDLLLIGSNGGSAFDTRMYENTGGDLGEDAGASGSLAQLGNGDAAWGDINKDGFIDVVLIGEGTSGAQTTLYLNDGDGTFSASSQVFPAVENGAVAWGDYDNDGDLDLLISGTATGGPLTNLFENNDDGTFQNSGIAIIDVEASDLAWADYNNDGFLDFVVAGDDGGGPITQLYENDGTGGFTAVTSGFANLENASLAWADYNIDGKIDLLISGSNAGVANSEVYTNNTDLSNGNISFTPVGGLTGVENGKAAWGDYNNDGYIDIILSGGTGIGVDAFTTLLYTNNNGGSFTLDNINSAELPGLDGGGDLAWGDFDEDGKLDLAFVGITDNSPSIKRLILYQNQNANTPSTPGAPQALNAVQSNDDIIFNWAPPTGFVGPLANSLSYNLYIGTSPNAIDIKSPAANTNNGFRRIVQIGPTHLNSYTLKNATIGTYYWAVQAVDADFEGSPFSPLDAFNFVPPGANFIDNTAANFPAPPEGLSNGGLQWGDYDNDGDLDLLYFGENSSGTKQTSIYQSTQSGFILDAAASNTLDDISQGDVAWGDLDNDGNIDLALTGETASGNLTEFYFNDGAGNFTAQNFTGLALGNAAIELADLDNDGDLDAVLSGFDGQELLTPLYNDGAGNFAIPGISLLGLQGGDIALGDVNNDNYIDILASGNSSTGFATVLYLNDTQGGWTLTPTTLPNLGDGSIDLADFDNDDDLDVLISGRTLADTLLQVYENNGSATFSLNAAALPGIVGGNAKWGDVNNDGLLDILLSGTSVGGGAPITAYFNNSGTTFAQDVLNSTILTDVGNCHFAWGDYDNDGKLDFVLAGRISDAPVQNTFILYRNINSNPPSEPDAPQGLTAVQVNNDVVLTWNPPTTFPNATVDGLSYNLYIGSTFGGIDVKAPSADLSSGFQKLIKTGHSHQNSWIISDLSIGTYYWNVQAIDHDFEGSPFATGSSFTFIPEGADFISVTDDTTFTSLPGGLSFAAVDWGDYDNDGDLDLLAAGLTNAGAYATNVYKNNNGVLEIDNLASAPLIGIANGNVDWGDYDNDGNLDILLVGQTNVGSVAKVYRNTGGGSFADLVAPLDPVSNADAAWGDYDNDGDLDIILSGFSASLNAPVTKLFQNGGSNSFADIGFPFQAVQNATLKWGDYDRDGRIDLFLSGQGTTGPVSKIYHNESGGFFTDVPTSIGAVFNGAADWGDLNNDGFLDIAITGNQIVNGFSPFSGVYIYNQAGNNFQVFSSGIVPSVGGDLKWADYNDDGFKDLVVTGREGTGPTEFGTHVYLNNAGASLAEDTLNSSLLVALHEGAALAWGDYDNDNKIDLVFAGSTSELSSSGTFQLFRNIDENPNRTLTAPTLVGSNQNGEDVTLSWTPLGNIPGSQLNGVSYNVRIGTAESLADWLNPMSNLNNGYRKVVQLGNAMQNTSWTISGLEPGTYYWEVQSIDMDFEGSEFSNSGSFTYIPPGAIFVDETSTKFQNIPSGLNNADIAWGDYDNDNDLDLVLSGETNAGAPSTVFYENDGGVFTLVTSISAILQDVTMAAMEWGDYDNDGFLDIVIAGRNNGTPKTNLYRNNGNKSFNLVPNSFPGIEDGGLGWADFDLDGDLDLFLIGETNTVPEGVLYVNEGGNFVESGIGFPGLTNSTIEWGDYDADGDPDLMLTGASGTVPNSKILRNDDGDFNDLGQVIDNVTNSATAWADFNNDGYLDILLTGDESPNVFGFSPISKIYYHNPTTGLFDEQSFNIQGVRDGAVAVGDYNEDGFIDFVLSGRFGANVSDRTTKVYSNIGGLGFNEDAVNSSILQDLDGASALAWGDFDNDNKLDLAATGRSSNTPLTNTFVLYQNIFDGSLSTISEPVGLGSNQFGNQVTLSWSPPENYDASLVNGLSYQIYLGTTGMGIDRVSPMSNIGTGYRRIVRLGNVRGTSIVIENLPSGDYFWGVQAIKPDWEGSAFSTESSFEVDPPDFVDVTNTTFPGFPGGLADAEFAWGDFDNDEDLDVLISGSISGNPFTSLYRNDAGVFADAGVSFQNISNATIEWQDFDLDGFLDLFMTGQGNTGWETSIYRNNQSGGFTEIFTGLTAVSQSTGGWIDYDRDGYPDFILAGLATSGGKLTKLYRNNQAGAFEDPGINFTGITSGDMAWGDIDKDGDLDLLMAGDGPSGPLTQLFENEGNGTFTNVITSLTPVSQPSVAFADYNNNGNRDILIAGISSGGPVTQVWENDGSGQFNKVADLQGIRDGKAIWGDYNDDGLTDIALTGTMGASGNYISTLYKNLGSGFAIDDLNGPILQNAGDGSSMAWADYDNDGKLDLILAGETVSGTIFQLFNNEEATVNVSPVAPSSGFTFSQNGLSATLSWDQPTGFFPGRVGGLTYNFYLSTVSGTSDRHKALASIPGGIRKVVAGGNAQNSTTIKINDLAPGTYFWGVQAIDVDYEGSPFSAEQSFVLAPPTFTDITNTSFIPSIPQGLSEADADFGDYDNDGDLDLLVAGQVAASTGTTILYENDGLVMTPSPLGVALPDVRFGSVDWGDYDNDGDLDILITGQTSFGSISEIYRNDGNAFTNINAGLTGVGQGQGRWADINNDGLLDFALVGLSNTGIVGQIYLQNDNSTFSIVSQNSPNSLSALWQVDFDWGDFNNDTYPDLLITGNSLSGPQTNLYRNLGDGQFEVVNISPLPLPALESSVVRWGDYDNDGNLDIAISGTNLGAVITRVYKNNSNGAFTDITAGLMPVFGGDISWGDFNDDGFRDLVISGTTEEGDPSTILYTNNNGSGFIREVINSPILSNVNEGSVAKWGDIDQNQKLDLLLIGQNSSNPLTRIFQIYRNDDPNPNLTPQAPVLAPPIQEANNTMRLSWLPPASAPNTLSYNVYVGTAPGLSDVVSPEADTTNGYRRVVGYGNARHNTTFSLSGLEAGTYYWSAQSIDPDFEGSAFAEEGSFTFIPEGASFLEETSVVFGSNVPQGLNDGLLLWVDYDNDGDLDLFASGETTAGTFTTDIYENDGGILTRDPLASSDLENLRKTSAAWADYDLDGDLDLVLTGERIDGPFSELYNNENGRFSITGINLGAMSDGAVAWGDINNDGCPDLVISGFNNGPLTFLFENDCNGLLTLNAFVPLKFYGASSIAFEDFDKDGDLDLLMTGETSPSGPSTELYVNNGEGGFENTPLDLASVPNVASGSVDWGDFDNDGYPDILISGNTGGNLVSEIYRNIQGSGNFVLSQSLTPVQNGTAKWGDFNDDHFPDIILTGQGADGNPITEVYVNNQGFLSRDLANTAIFADVGDGSNFAWGDFDQDFKLDVALIGREGPASKQFQVYRNIDATSNHTAIAPNPFGLNIQQVGDQVTFSWNTPDYPANLANIVDGLSYNLYVGTQLGQADKISPSSDLNNGSRQVVFRGNVGQRTSYTLNGLTQGNYVWSVQTIEQDFEGSPFVNPEQFGFIPPDFSEQTTSLFTSTVPEGLISGDLSWVDYNLDGKLDLFLLGEDVNGGLKILPYLNSGFNTFSPDNLAAPSIVKVRRGSMAWGDMNNDGSPDLLITGQNESGELSTNLYWNNSSGNGRFFRNAQVLDLAPLVNSRAALGDYDADGDLDILLVGDSDFGPISRLYRNDIETGTFEFIPSTGLPGASGGSVIWEDFNLDGKLDVFLSGLGQGATPISEIFYGDGEGSFTPASLGLIPLRNSSADVADFDNNGFPDLVLAGRAAGGDTIVVYQNRGLLGMQPVLLGVDGLSNGSVEWGDYNDDGYPDILGTGNGNNGPATILIENRTGSTGSPAFAQSLINSSFIKNIRSGFARWGDYNNDGKLDFAMLGELDNGDFSFDIYRNDNTQPNLTIEPPRGLSASQNGDQVTFRWSKPANYPDPIIDGVTYNIYIRTVPAIPNIKSPEANLSSGYRRLVQIGNAGRDTTWTINGITQGTYFWSVQAIEQDYEGGPFASPQTFGFEPPDFSDVTDSVFSSLPPGLQSSKMEWGDFNNDDLLDLMVMGFNGNRAYTRLFLQGASGFIESNFTLPELHTGDLALGDYNNDGWLDFAICGTNGTIRESFIYRNTGSGFVLEATLDGVDEGSLEWGDYDNDGDLDLALTGSSNFGPISKIYRNLGADGFLDINANLEGVSQGTSIWGDIDNDDDLDLFISGNASTGRFSGLYLNDPQGGFELAPASTIRPLRESDAAWGDFDNDGFMDLALVGEGVDGVASLLYQNNQAGGFTLLDSLIGVRNGSVSWADYNSDGYRDLIISGKTGPGALDRTTTLYQNLQDATFKIDTINSDFFVDVDFGSHAAWGDFNRDSKIDVAIAGLTASLSGEETNVLRIYKNNLTTVSLPKAPTGLRAQVFFDRVELSWDESSNLGVNLRNGLTYNVYLDTVRASASLLDPMANIQDRGLRKIARLGNAGHGTKHIIRGLKEDVYYWSVQAIDADYEGSAFAADYVEADSFKFTEPIFSDETANVLLGTPYEGLAFASIDFGDFDNDGDLDLLVTGENNNQPVTDILENVAGIYRPFANSLLDVSRGIATWGDYNRDGFLDILLTGQSSLGTPITQVYRSVNGVSFTNTAVTIDGLQNSHAEWADFDIDGDLDFVLIGDDNGVPFIKLFRQDFESNNIVFNLSDAGALLPNITLGDIAFGDYNQDGHLDLALSGYTGAVQRTLIYEYDKDREEFVDTTPGGFPNLSNGSVEWGDVNNDGLLDLLITGDNQGTPVTKLFLNNLGQGGANFVEMTGPIFTPVTDGNGAFGDYNDDGYIDIILVGQSLNGESDRVAHIFKNINGTNFERDQFAEGFLRSVENGAQAVWGDYDNDGKLDLVIAGRSGSSDATLRFYHNNERTPNRIPLPPINLRQERSRTNLGVKISWDPPADFDSTTVRGLGYNLYLWYRDGSEFRMQPHADTASGYRKVVRLGNANSNLSWTIENLEEGTYLYSVQSIDTDFEGSEFATPRSFKYNPTTFDDRTPDLFPNTEPESVNSSASAWGDYDNDGDLDILSAGEVTDSLFSTAIYRNDFNQITLETTFDIDPIASANLPGVRWASVDWGDYDNDGDLDIILAGQDNDLNRLTRIYRNDVDGNTRIFVWDTLASSAFSPVWGASLAWADYNNDGDLDLLVAGLAESGPSTKLYKNLGNRTFAEDEAGNNLQGIFFGSVDWGDYNKDGYKDIALTGEIANGVPFSRIYRNDGNGTSFSGRETPIIPLRQSSLKWGDYNNDTFLDLIITGERTQELLTTEILEYNPDSNAFVVKNFGFEPKVKQGSVDWGDFNNDGFADLLITGKADDTTRISKVYENDITADGKRTFSENITTSGILQDVELGTSVWGDFDADGRLDILLTGRTADEPIERTFAVYRNVSTSTPSSPDPPQNLTVDERQQDRVILRWDFPSSQNANDSAIVNGYSYNIWVVNCDSSTNHKVSMSDTTNGYRKIVNRGNAGQVNFYELRNLPSGNYTWAVQAVDADYEGSDFVKYDGCFTYDSPAPIIVDSSFSYLYVKDSVGINSWIQVQDVSLIERVELRYRGIAFGDWQRRDVPLEGNRIYRFNFTNEFVLDDERFPDDPNGDEIGIEYKFRVVGKFGIETQSHTGFMNIRYPDGFRMLDFNYGPNVEDYNTISVPLVLDDSSITENIVDDLGEYDIFKWRLWHTGPGERQEYTNGLENIEVGKGYWLIMRDIASTNSVIETGPGNTVRVRRDKPYQIELKKGWNQVGNPYMLNLGWNDILNFQGVGDSVLSDTIRTPVVWRSGRYQKGLNNWLKGEAAFVYALKDISFPINPIKNTELNRFAYSSLPVSKIVSKKEWSVDLGLQIGDAGFDLGGIGMHPQADTALDRLDRLRPPRPGQYLDINFYHDDDFPEWPRFARDVVPAADHYIWEFTVEQNLDHSTAELSWDQVGLQGTNLQLYLYNVEEQTYISMREHDHYRYFSRSGKHRFRILYGDEEFIKSHLDAEKVKLGNAYPNPFSNKVTIPFQLPSYQNYQSVDRYRVQLGVYNPLGQLVAILEEGEFVPGFYEIEWDGLDRNGLKASEGIYIYQLKVSWPNGTFGKTARMIKK